MQECEQTDYVVNFASFASQNAEIIDNSGLTLLKLLVAVGVKEVIIAGMDGYSTQQDGDYFEQQLEYDYSKQAEIRNVLISGEIKEIQKVMKLSFLTPSQYSV
ncbi:MAG: hypothetical protein GX567_16065 [Clostridia bacterium]|nr:hypothetical protein [Clostridia bacterium]